MTRRNVDSRDKPQRTTARRGPEHDLRTLTAEFLAQEARLRQGGGPEAIERQHAKGRKTARERIETLLDPGSPSLELGLVGRLPDVRGVGRRGRARGRHGDRLGRRPARDGRRQRRHGQGRRMLSDDDQEDPAGPDDRRPEPAAAGLSRRLVGRLPADAGRGLSRRRRLRADLPQQRRALGGRASRSTPRSWATASRAERICRSSATRS